MLRDNEPKCDHREGPNDEVRILPLLDRRPQGQRVGTAEPRLAEQSQK